MANGYALCIGLNLVNPAHYQGWDGKLNAPEKDASDMMALAKSAGFKADGIIGSNATRQNVVTAINNAAASLQSDDIFLLYYSGHGGQIPDFDGDEDDGTDETWCLYNGQLMDDEIKQLWLKFRQDVKVFVLSDSCHSGTIVKAFDMQMDSYSDAKVKSMPIDIALSTYTANKDIYDQYIAGVDNAKSSFNEADIKANIRLISGCQDNQSSYDGAFNSKFTEQLLRVWNGGKFKGNYEKFYAAIIGNMPSYQSPNHLVFGKTNLVYDAQVPFTIGAAPKVGSGKFLIDLSTLELTSEQTIAIDSALQTTVSAELAKLGAKGKISLMPLSGKKGGAEKDITMGYRGTF